MADLGKLMKMANEIGGPLVVLNMNGDPELVVLTFDAYQELRSNKRYVALSERLTTLTKATEELNQQILEVQMEDDQAEFDPEEEKEEAIYIEPLLPGE